MSQWWRIAWHDVPNRRMTSAWFLAPSLDAAIELAMVSAYGGESYSLESGPVPSDSEIGRRLAPDNSVPTKGRAADRAKGWRS